VSDQVLLRY